jgi:hypothetical protein
VPHLIFLDRARLAAALAIGCLCQGLACPALAGDDSIGAAAELGPRPATVTTLKPVVPEGQTDSLTGHLASEGHPLESVLQFARSERDFLSRTVRDFTCRLVKRERIDGFLQDYQFVDMRVREAVHEHGSIVVPLSIYLHFLAPAKIAGRQVLFIEGKNDGKILVRNGGKHFDYVTVQVDPDGDNARRESLVPITETGFNRVLSRMIDVLERHQRVDAAGTNTVVSKVPGVKINKRPSTMIKIVHPTKQDGLEFHIANVYTDDELRVPVRVEYYDWIKWQGQSPPLIAEYTYTNLKLNPKLADEAFSSAGFREKR